MKINTLFYIIKQGIVNIFRNKWYSLASISTISACLFLFGIFYAIMANLQNSVLTAEEGVSVTVFFKEDEETHENIQVSDVRVEEIKRMIESRIEVSKVNFVTADEVWHTLGPQWYGENYEEGFPENPLAGMDCFEVFLSDVSMHDALVKWLQSIPEVGDINDAASIANILSGTNVLIAYLSVGIIAVLLGVSIFLIGNTVTVGISVRKEEINIMKYIGATDFFVRAPFVLEGMLIGLMGAAVPLGIIYGLYNYILNYIVESFSMLKNLLHFLTVEQIFQFLTPVSLIVGIGIGFMGSITTVRKHLNV